MISSLLPISNLNRRPYVHGTSVVRSLLTSLSALGRVRELEIKFTRPLFHRPYLHLYLTAERPSSIASCVTGHLELNGRRCNYELVDSDVECTEYETVDEVLLATRIEEGENSSRLVLEGTDPFVGWNVLGLSSNCELFPRVPEMQMWFTGNRFYDIDFVSLPPVSVELSRSYVLLSPRCVRRNVFYNGTWVGTRTSVYGKRINMSDI